VVCRIEVLTVMLQKIRSSGMLLHVDWEIVALFLRVVVVSS